MKLDDFDQYRRDIFKKTNINFKKGRKILDVGCGDGADLKVFQKFYKLNTFGIDIYKDKSLKKIEGINFKKAGIYKIPFEDNYFDYVFLHNVLHHIDEPKQRKTKHLQALEELKRVTKNKGSIIIVEGNRYNPLFYPHMVKMHGHDHFKQSYFKEIINEVFDKVKYKHFEAHYYPVFSSVFKIYERIMESIMPNKFLAYNVAIITK